MTGSNIIDDVSNSGASKEGENTYGEVLIKDLDRLI